MGDNMAQHEDDTVAVSGPVADLAERADRMIALMGFPNAGKSAYLMALGKTLSSPKGNDKWRITASSEEILKYVSELILYEERCTWDHTDPGEPPRPLDLFQARRHGFKREALTAFDTSGEHYQILAGGGRATTPETLALAEALGQDILPRCRGAVALLDCSLSEQKLTERIHYYKTLFNRVFGTSFPATRHEDADTDRPAPPPAKSPSHWYRLPLAFVITKVDLLNDERIQMPTEDCAYLRYLRAHGLNPSAAGLQNYNTGVTSYTIHSEVFLDAEKYPDPDAGRAVIEDFVACRMTPLADMLVTLQHEGRYDVSLFPVSAWGMKPEKDETGLEQRPEMSQIRPARVLEPMFWVLEQIYKQWRSRTAKRWLQRAFLAFLGLLLVGPVAMWGLLWGGRQFADRGDMTAAYYLLSAANYHPYARYVAARWEPASLRRLQDTNRHVAELLNDNKMETHSLALVSLSNHLPDADPEMNDIFSAIYQRRFEEAVRSSSVTDVWKAGKAWLNNEGHRGQVPFSEAFLTISRALAGTEDDSAASPFDYEVWREVWQYSQDHAEHLTAAALVAAHRFPAKQYAVMAEHVQSNKSLQGIPADLRDEVKRLTGNQPSLYAAFDLYEKADAHARRSADFNLMGRAYSGALACTKLLIEKKIDQAIDDTSGADFNAVLAAWNDAVQRAREYPSVHPVLRTKGNNLLEALKNLVDGGITKSTVELLNHVAEALHVAGAIANELDIDEGWASPRNLAAKRARTYLELAYAQCQKEETYSKAVETALNAWKQAVPSIGEEALSKDTLHSLQEDLPDTWNVTKRLLDWWLPPTGETGSPKQVLHENVLREFGLPDEVTKAHWVRHWQNWLRDHADKGHYKEICLRIQDLARKSPDADLFDEPLGAVLTAVNSQLSRPLDQPDEVLKLLDEVGKASQIASCPNILERSSHLADHIRKIRTMVFVDGPQPFYVDPTEVTVAAYRAFLSRLPEEEKALRWPRYSGPSTGGTLVRLGEAGYFERYAEDGLTRDQCPVIGVTYADAVAFAEACGKRLPTFNEYQIIARKLPESVDEDNLRVNKPQGVARVRLNNGDAIKIPGAATTQTIYGIAGNVREWCAGAASGCCYATGLSWYDVFEANWQQALYENALDERNPYTGFRLVADCLPPDPDVTARAPLQPDSSK